MANNIRFIAGGAGARLLVGLLVWSILIWSPEASAGWWGDFTSWWADAWAQIMAWWDSFVAWVWGSVGSVIEKYWLTVYMFALKAANGIVEYVLDSLGITVKVMSAWNALPDWARCAAIWLKLPESVGLFLAAATAKLALKVALR